MEIYLLLGDCGDGGEGSLLAGSNPLAGVHPLDLVVVHPLDLDMVVVSLGPVHPLDLVVVGVNPLDMVARGREYLLHCD